MDPLSHRHDPATSHAAARSMRSQAETDRMAVLDAYWIAETLDRRGLTADEAAEILGWDDVYRARRRVSELKAAGLLRETGETRKTASGRRATVLEAVRRVTQGRLL